MIHSIIVKSTPRLSQKIWRESPISIGKSDFPMQVKTTPYFLYKFSAQIFSGEIYRIPYFITSGYETEICPVFMDWFHM